MVNMTSKPLISVKDVVFQYRDAPGPTIADINLQLQPGSRVVVLGHNGSGKSTLLSVIAGRRKAKSGTVQVMGSCPFDDTTMTQHISLIGSPWPPEAFFANTVDKVASPAPVPERRADIAAKLHLRMSRYVDKMSSGEKRRVQILHGLLYPTTVFLLDECNTDVDVAERRTVLDLVRKECEERQGCALYATHIFDNARDWATHIMLMEHGRITSFVSVADVKMPLEEYAFRSMSRNPLEASGQLAYAHFAARASINPSIAEQRQYFSSNNDAHPHHQDPTSSNRGVPMTEVVIGCNGLTYKDVFSNLSFNIYRGERVLLCGCNGAGKSTLLNMLGGKQYFNNDNGALTILGRRCYDDMTLNGEVSFGGDWWTNVPGGQVHVREMLDINTSRGRTLVELLAVNMDWDVRHISSGEQKRVQLLLYLLEDKPIVLLDEATADLDVDQRHGLLQFLFEESVHRGVTVVYSTHIFGGLDGWASSLIILDRTVRGVHDIWRESLGQSVDLGRLTEELVMLKAREEY